MTKRKLDREDYAIGKAFKVDECENENFKDVESIIESTFLLKCSPDLLAFFNFCKTISSLAPLEALLDELNLRLVGPFELLNDKGIVSKDDNLTCCYRFFHDPPELVTVLTESSTGSFHIGYFRDDYKDMPTFLVSSNPMNDGKLKILGDNIFSALITHFEGIRKNAKNTPLLRELSMYAKAHNYDVQNKKSVVRDSVCPTLNGVGLYIDIKNDIGYRPLPISHGDLRSRLAKITEANDEQSRLKHQSQIEELMTFTQFANDEGDYGQGLELGLDLLAYHPSKGLITSANCLNRMIEVLLSTGYLLARRPKFADVIRQHMKRRPDTEVLTITDALKN